LHIVKGLLLDYEPHTVSLTVRSRAVLMCMYLVDAAEATDANRPT